MKSVLAQNLNIQLGGPESRNSIGISGPLVGINNLSDLINVVTSFVYPLATIVLLAALIWGGYELVMSGGEPEKINTGKAKITAGLVGFFLLVLSFLFSKLIGFIFGVGAGGI